MAQDTDLLERINALVDEEHALESGGPVDPDRLHDIEVALDQCWDLLRQRRARRDAGQDPSVAKVRAEETVERYEQ